MVDYSKWDHLDISDDEDDGMISSDSGYDDNFIPDERFVEGVQRGGNNSSVTKLTPGTSVTFGKGKVQYGKGEEEKEEKEEKEREKSKAKKEGEKTQEERQSEAYKRFTRNGGGRDGQSSTHIWGQTREEVQICVFVPAGSRGKDVKVDVKPVIGGSPHLRVSHLGKALVDDDLAHPVDTSEDALIGCYTLEDYDSTRRVVRVELKKSTVGSSVFWWDRALASDPKVSQDAIVDIDKSGKAEENRRKWQEAWEEAHREFRKQVANQKPVEIDVDN